MDKLIRVPVRALVERTLRSGDLALDAWSPNRSIDGLRAHQRIQQSRPEEYSKEVTLTHRVEMKGLPIEVAGRIDGVYLYPDRVIVDEIKTTTRPLEQLSRAQDPLHWGQAKIYAYIYAEQNDLDSILVQLTYCHLETGETQEIRQGFSRAELERFFLDVLGRFLGWIERIEAWREERDGSLRKLQFPYLSYRAGQRRIAVEVFRSVKRGGHLLVQAPTGFGKTMAVLFPALKAMGQNEADRLLYLTARGTGKSLAESSLESLRQQRARIKSVTLTAKDKICFNPEKTCNGEECGFARGFYDRIPRALEELFSRDDFTRAAVEEVARRHQVCPFELSLELAFWADVVIGDYNYAFDPGASLKRLFEDDNARRVLLVDEAHNLVDRAREMFSAEVRKTPLLALRRRTKGLPELFKSLGRVNAWLARKAKQCEAAGGRLSESDPPDGVYPLMKKFLRATEKWLLTSSGAPAPLREEILDVYFDVHRFLRVAEGYDEAYTSCYERTGKDLKVKLLCKDPSTQLAQALERARSTVFFSATLTPVDYFRKVFGCAPSARELVLASPFPPQHLCLLVSDHISTKYKKRQETREALTRSLVEFVEQRPGNYLLYFPSYEYLSAIHSSFSTHRPQLETLVQTPQMTELERTEFLARFSRHTERTLVGFAVMGGVFGEGIDLVGERLTGAAIVGVGLPGISHERELIREHFNRLGMGFEYAYLYPGMNRVLQAAGRVIRSERDRGVVLLIDERFTEARYRSLLPAEWRPTRIRGESAMQHALESFWGR